MISEDVIPECKYLLPCLECDKHHEICSVIECEYKEFENKMTELEEKMNEIKEALSCSHNWQEVYNFCYCLDDGDYKGYKVYICPYCGEAKVVMDE